MRRLHAFTSLFFVAIACNEALGLDPGRLGASGGGGTSGAPGSAAESGDSANGGTPPSGGTSGTSGESGESAGGAAGRTPGRGGSSSGSGNGGSSGSSDPGGAGAGGDGPCSSLECQAQGGDLCIDGECRDITTGDCDTLLGTEWIEHHPEDDAYVFGALGHFEADTLDTYPSYFNLLLAMREFSAHGPVPIDGKLRRPVLLTCRVPPFTGISRVRDALVHLIDVAGVSSILPLVDRSELLPLVDGSLNVRNDDVFFLDFGAPTGDLVSLLDKRSYDPARPFAIRLGRLWHMLGDSGLVSRPFAPLVERIEEHVNPGASQGQATHPTRLAVLTGSNNAFDVDMLLWLGSLDFSPVRINGALWREQPGNARVISAYPHEDALEALATFEADIVLDFSGVETLLPAIDTAMRASFLPPPFYVLPPTRFRPPLLLQQMRDDTTLRSRVVGVNFAMAEDSRLYDAYLERLQALAPDTLDVESSENFYDAVYFLIYATVAGGSGGFNTAAGMSRLTIGPRRDIGPRTIQSVTDRLLLDPTTTLALFGTLGPPDFHAPSGGRIAYADAWCVNEDLSFAMDVLRYDPTSDALLGTFPCFPF